MCVCLYEWFDSQMNCELVMRIGSQVRLDSMSLLNMEQQLLSYELLFLGCFGAFSRNEENFHKICLHLPTNVSISQLLFYLVPNVGSRVRRINA